MLNNKLIVEDSPKDDCWGWGPNKDGRNELGKIWMRLREEIMLKEMIVQGLISIQLGENPAIIEEKLLTFLSFTLKQDHFLTEINESV